jgi:hypothetical protein
MAQTLTILWQAPVPLPACNYTVAYRAKSAASYTFVNTTTSTSGSNSLLVSGLVPACYEGFVQSNCCGDNLSDLTHSYWGINTWQPLYAMPHLSYNLVQYQLALTSVYPNPYPTIVSGSFIAIFTSGTSTIPFSVTYPANSIYYNTIIGPVIGPIPTGFGATTMTISPVFDNGGTLQQRDTVNTPQYFGFYNTSGCTSGATTSGCTAPIWNGSPILLPSFTLDGFNVTSVDTMGNPIGGTIPISWIQSATFGGGSGIYSSITFQVFDSTGVHLQGSITVPYGVPGLNNAAIPITSTLGTITTGIQYLMKTLWADTSVSASQLFYLPTF